jgi:hypothetical protein
MKKVRSFFLLMLLLSYSTNGQTKQVISLQLSYNQIELGFEHDLLNERLTAGLYAGIGNEDINHHFDDFLCKLGFGYVVYSNFKNQVSIQSGFGLYFSNNDYYSITVPIVNIGTRYTRFIGKERKQSLFVDAGYRYGKREYKQVYSSEIAVVSTIGIFKISPLYFLIGYGFKF